jgi:hypothetical protein
MGYKGEYCDTCYIIPEFEKVELIWKRLGDGQGELRCPLCLHVYGAYYCPYIPEFK